MRQYLDFMRHVLDHGAHKSDRTGTGTRSVFGHQMRFDLAEGFPLLTTKKLHLRSILVELLWFLRGDTNVAWLKEHKVSIWDEWADQDGELGPVYGRQWRAWPASGGREIDQMRLLLDQIRGNPDSRRLIVSAWNVGELDKMALAPCHALFQFYVCDGKLSCQLYQRSADIFLGVPFNIASYAALTLMIAQVCGLKPGDFVWTGGDCHLYTNHLDQAREQLGREPRKPPMLTLNPDVTDLFAFRYEDFALSGYEPLPHIKAPVAVWKGPLVKERPPAKVEPPSLSLIAAVDDGGLIGRDGGLPWRLPNDMQHFKEKTLRKTVLMGRRTWESIGRPLPNRENWVVSRQPGFHAEGARVFPSVPDALATNRAGELMVIGGAEVYRETLMLARRIYLTRVHAHLRGDVRFPAFDEAGFEEVSRQDHPADERHPYAYSFVVLERR